MHSYISTFTKRKRIHEEPCESISTLGRVSLGPAFLPVSDALILVGFVVSQHFLGVLLNIFLTRAGFLTQEFSVNDLVFWGSAARFNLFGFCAPSCQGLQS